MNLSGTTNTETKLVHVPDLMGWTEQRSKCQRHGVSYDSELVAELLESVDTYLKSR